jgi:SAM-dependent MidA family methyltransferase
MGWREERKLALEKSMDKILSLLGDYEQQLINEIEPKAKDKLKTQISDLKQQMQDCGNDLAAFEQEQGNNKNLSLTMANVTHYEIDLVITALLHQDTSYPINIQDRLQTTKAIEKMSKNNLTNQIKFLLDMGLAKASDVHHFIENLVKINLSNVPEALKFSLNAEYKILKESGLQGDELFKQMYNFSHNNNPDPSRQVAGLAVLCYFFEACDVFEP